MSHVEQSDSTSSKRALLVPYIQRQIYLVAHAANRTPPHRSGCYRMQSRLAVYSETYQGHAYESNNIGSSSTSNYRHVHPQWMSRAREQEELHIPRAFTQVRQCNEKLAAISSMRPGLAWPDHFSRVVIYISSYLAPAFIPCAALVLILLQTFGSLHLAASTTPTRVTLRLQVVPAAMKQELRKETTRLTTTVEILFAQVFHRPMLY